MLYLLEKRLTRPFSHFADEDYYQDPSLEEGKGIVTTKTLADCYVAVEAKHILEKAGYKPTGCGVAPSPAQNMSDLNSKNIEYLMHEEAESIGMSARDYIANKLKDRLTAEYGEQAAELQMTELRDYANVDAHKRSQRIETLRDEEARRAAEIGPTM